MRAVNRRPVDTGGGRFPGEVQTIFDRIREDASLSMAARQRVGIGSQRIGIAIPLLEVGPFEPFARTGDPNVPGSPSWSPYDAKNRSTMIFDATLEIWSAPLDEERAIWAGSS